MANRLIDITGRRFGILKVLSRHGTRGIGAKSKPTWLCQCGCGKQTVLTGNVLQRGQKSCGCLPPGPKGRSWLNPKPKVNKRPEPRKASVCACGDHAWLCLTRGFVTLLDPADAPLAETYSWSAKQYSKHLVYARKGQKAPYGLHNFLLGMSHLDHINGNGLDNRRNNLRPANSCENQQNRRATKGAKGVDYKPHAKMWRARIGANGKRVDLGYFKTETEAAEAYARAADKLHGEFAKY